MTGEKLIGEDVVIKKSSSPFFNELGTVTEYFNKLYTIQVGEDQIVLLRSEFKLIPRKETLK